MIKRSSLCMFLVVVLSLAVFAMPASATDVYSYGTAVNVPTDGSEIVLDTIVYNGVTVKAYYTTHGTFKNDDSRYCCAALVSRFYSEVFNISVSNLWSTSSTPNASKGTFYETSEPEVGDIVQWKYASVAHWAIVKAVNGDRVTIIQQNFWLNDYTAGPKNMVIGKSSDSYRFWHWSERGSKYTIRYNANGGTGTMSDTVVTFGVDTPLRTNTFTRDGFTFAGWNAKRAYDNKWLYCDANGSNSAWYTEGSQPSGYRKYVYRDGVKVAKTSPYNGDVATFYAVWDPILYLNFYSNFSGKNLISGTAFEDAGKLMISSRDTSVSTVSIDSSQKHNDYNSLKIVNSSAGSSGKDLNIISYAQYSTTQNGGVGDNCNLVLSFWAKSSTSNNKMYIRWGYQSTSEYTSVTLNNNWTYYQILLPKKPEYGRSLHPYFTNAGTVWISELQLEYGSSATAFVPETGGHVGSTGPYSAGAKYTLLDAPAAPRGYTFEGWYTAPVGGTKITSSTTVKTGSLNVFAHWSKNGWVSEKDDWYFYENNQKVTGWKNDNGLWYYMDADGVMQTGWVNDGGTWYYLGTSGNMRTGWVQVNGSWYYLSASGAMKTGWVQSGNQWYYLGASGAMRTGWVQIGSTWYYLGSDGAMKTGWAQDGGNWYYLGSDGAMRTGWQNIGGTWYYLNNAMVTGWKQISGTWYYFKSSGAMACNETVNVGGVNYRFSSSGAWIQ